MILDKITSYKKIQVEEEKEKTPQKVLIEKNKDIKRRNFKDAIKKEHIAFIAEIKKASPSKGIINKDFDLLNIAKIYEDAKVDAISVLTEDKFFMGRDEYILQGKKVNSKPVLRKDFIVDKYQLYQSKAIGADCVLLITSVLGNGLKGFYLLTKELGLDAIVEVHDEKELDIALNSGCEIIGINNRDLKDFSVNLKTTERLIKNIPKGIIVVSESGIKSPKDVSYLSELGVNAVLIGETFMKNLNYVKEFIKESGVRDD